MQSWKSFSCIIDCLYAKFVWYFFARCLVLIKEVTRRLDQLREAKRIKDLMAAPVLPEPGSTSTEHTNKEAQTPAAEPEHTNTEAPSAAEPEHTNTEAPSAAEPEHTNTEAPSPAAEPEHTNTEAPSPTAEPGHTNTEAPGPTTEPEHTNTAWFEDSYTQPDEDPYMTPMQFEKFITSPASRPIATPVRSTLDLRLSQDAQVLRSPTPSQCTDPEPADVDTMVLHDGYDDLASRHDTHLRSLISAPTLNQLS